jgi:outer membrane receptor for ferrienterochelin and colicin
VFNVGDTAQSYAAPAVYATGTIQLGERFTLLPGVRMAYYALQAKKATVDPRVRFMWQVGEQTTIKGGVGLYSQLPDLISLNPIWGNPRASVERSVHTSLGVLQTFEELGLSLEVTGFYKYVFDRSTASNADHPRAGRHAAPRELREPGHRSDLRRRVSPAQGADQEVLRLDQLHADAQPGAGEAG